MRCALQAIVYSEEPVGTMSKLDAEPVGKPGLMDDSAHGSKFPKADVEGKHSDELGEPEYVGKSKQPAPHRPPFPTFHHMHACLCVT
jgi:hypothetical protein